MIVPRVPYRDDGNWSSSYFQKTVMLRDWWLIKSHQEFEGKRFGVAGTELMASVKQRAVRVFTSAPIVKASDVFTLETSDGICILLKGFINKERTIKNGFIPEIFRHFIFGFPPCWEEICKRCCEGTASCDTSVDSMSLRTDTDLFDRPLLTPCKTKGRNLEDEPMMEPKRFGTCNPVTLRSLDKQQPSSLLNSAKTQIENNVHETNNKEGCNKDPTLLKVGMVAAGENPGRKGRKTRTESTKQVASSERIKLKQNTVRKSLRLQSKDLGKSTETERKSSPTKVSNHADKNSDSLNEAKSAGAEENDSNGIENDVVSADIDAIMPIKHLACQSDGLAKRRAGPVSKDSMRRKYPTRESVRSERHNIRLDEINASPISLSKDCEKTIETGRKGNSNKGMKAVNANGHLDPSYHYGAVPEEDESCVRKEDPTGQKLRRRINFDLEATPGEHVRKDNAPVVAPESLSFKRSRSGRLLVSNLEFWRNQVAVYDADRKIIGIREGVDATTPTRGSGSQSQRRRR